MTTPFFADNNQALLQILNQSNQATAIYTGAELTIKLANPKMLQFWGKDHTVLEKAFEDALPELRGQPFPSILKEVWSSGNLYEGKEMEASLEINGSLVRSYFDFIYQPIFDQFGNMLCIYHTAWDVSERVAAREVIKEKEDNEQRITEELEAANEEYRITNEDLALSNIRLNETHDRLVYTENRMQQLVNSTPVGLTLLRGENMIIESANEGMLEIWGHKQEQVIGRPMLEVFPLLKGHTFSRQLDEVFTSARNVWLSEVIDSSRENEHTGRKYLSIDFFPLLDPDGNVDAIMATVRDTTEQVVAKKSIEENERQLNTHNDELASLNEELQSTNEELAAINEEYNATNEQLDEYNQTIQSINNRLSERNENLDAANSAYRKQNKDLRSDNKGLSTQNIQLRNLNDAVTKLNDQLVDSENVFTNLIAQSPIAIMLLKGEDLTVTIINAPMLELLGKDERIIGKPLLKELPELAGQPAANKLLETLKDGLS